MMKILVMVNQKGGVGKILIFVYFVFDFFECGLWVVVIDLDFQGNVFYMFKDFVIGLYVSKLFGVVFVGGWIEIVFVVGDGQVVCFVFIEFNLVLVNVEWLLLDDVCELFGVNIKVLVN